MRAGIAVAVVAAVFGAVGLALQLSEEPVELAVPAVGEAVAERLPDGTPVFVVTDEDGEVVVLSPVSTHLDHLVVWCPAARAFVEPVGASLFDAGGRWVTGPAPTGLARYERSVDPEGGIVRVGALQEPQPRWERPERPPFDPSDCVVTEGGRDGVEPALPPLVSLAHLEQAVGRRVVVAGRLRLDGQGRAWLCPSGLAECPDEKVEVASLWWRWWLDHFRGWAEGRFMVRVDAPRRVSELVQIRDVEEQNYWEHLRGVSRTTYTEGTATVIGVDLGRWHLLVEHLELPDGPAVEDRTMLPLREEPWPVQVVDDRPPHDLSMRVLSPAEFATVVRDDGPVPVELTVDDDGHVVNVWIRDGTP